jgi:DNA polymerase (family 10)
MVNTQIADLFEEIASLLELHGESNPFRVRAYRRAALTLKNLTESVSDIAERGELDDIPGIGKDLAGKIREYLKSGRITLREDLKRNTPDFMLRMLEIPGMGPKTARTIHERFKPGGYPELKKLARSGALRELPGIREKTERHILEGIEITERKHSRVSIGEALPLARSLVAGLSRLDAVDRADAAGSLRRMRETIGDVDILVASSSPQAVMDAFVKMDGVWKVLAHGHARSSVVMREGMQVDLRVVEKECYGAALLYFTGSKDHSIRLRGLAKKKGYKINEYGLFEIRSGKRIASAEKDIYEALGLAYIPPELREDRGEIEAAARKRLPRLVELKDLKGDLHAHTDWTDGVDSIRAMAEAAQKMGLEYLAVTDHSRSLHIAGGLSSERLSEHSAAVRELNKTMPGIRLLAGAEVDVLEDGSLDYPSDLLEKLDFVVASIHSGFRQGKARLTERLVRAMRSGRVDLIGHPTGRLFGERNAYELDFDLVFKTAAETRTALEINGCPERLDLDDLRIREAVRAGVTLAVSSDAHSKSHFNNLEYGVGTARRGWCEKDDILNCLPLKELLKKNRP